MLGTLSLFFIRFISSLLLQTDFQTGSKSQTSKWDNWLTVKLRYNKDIQQLIKLISIMIEDQYSTVFVDAMRYRSAPSLVPPIMPLVPSVGWNTEAEDGRGDSAGWMRLRKYFFSSFVPLYSPRLTSQIVLQKYYLTSSINVTHILAAFNKLIWPVKLVVN